MSSVELIAELTDICIRQAEIIKAQAFMLAQFGAEVKEEEALREQNRLKESAGEWVYGEHGAKASWGVGAFCAALVVDWRRVFLRRGHLEDFSG